MNMWYDTRDPSRLQPLQSEGAQDERSAVAPVGQYKRALSQLGVAHVSPRTKMQKCARGCQTYACAAAVTRHCPDIGPLAYVHANNVHAPCEVFQRSHHV
eukprot:351557-Chlamydomonas_euryale.AAC.19